MTTTIGRVDFIANLNGDNIPRQARVLGEKIAASGGDAGKEFAKEFEHSFDAELSTFGDSAARTLSEKGRLLGRSFTSRIESVVKRDMNRIADETAQALTTKKAFKRFAAGFPTATDAINALIANIKRLNKEQIVIGIDEEGEDILGDFFDEGQFEQAEKQIAKWGKGLKISESALRRSKKAAEDLRIEIDQLNRVIRDSDALQGASDKGEGLADTYNKLKGRIDELTKSGKLNRIEQARMVDALEMTAAKVEDRVAAEERAALVQARAIHMEHQRAEELAEIQRDKEKLAAREIDMEHQGAEARAQIQRDKEKLAAREIDIEHQGAEAKAQIILDKERLAAREIDLDHQGAEAKGEMLREKERLAAREIDLDHQIEEARGERMRESERLAAREIDLDHQIAEAAAEAQEERERLAAREIDLDHQIQEARADRLRETEAAAAREIDLDHQAAESKGRLREAILRLDSTMGDTRAFRARIVALGSLDAAVRESRRNIFDAGQAGLDTGSQGKRLRALDGLVEGYHKLSAAAGKAVTSLTAAGKADSGGGKNGFLSALTKGAVAGDLKQFVFYLSLILAGFQQIAAISSGLGAGLTALLSSAAFAAGGLLVAVLGIGAAFAWMLTHATAAIDFMAEEFPAAKAGMDALTLAAQNDSRAFAAAWGPALADFTNKLADLWANDRLGEMSGRALGAITEQFTAVLNSDAYRRFEEAMNVNLPAAMVNLGAAGAQIFSGILTVISVASPLIVALTDHIAEFWTKWANGISAAADDGTLRETLNTMFTSLALILGLVESLGGMFSRIFTAGVGPGNEIVELIISLVDQFNAWMDTLAGQNALATWFDNGVTTIRLLFDLLGALGTALNKLVTPEAMQMMFTFLTNLQGVATFFGQITAIIGQLDVFGLIAQAFATLGVALLPVLNLLAPIFSFLQNIATVLMNSVTIALQIVTPFLAGLQFALEFVSLAFQKLTDWMVPFQEVFMSVGAAIQNAVDTVLAGLITALGEVFDAFIAMLPGPEELERFVNEQLIPAIDSFAQFLLKVAVPAMLTFAGWIVKYVVPIAQGLWSIFWNFVIPALEGFVTGLGNIQRAASPWAAALSGAIQTLFAPLQGLITLVGNAIAAIAALTGAARARTGAGGASRFDLLKKDTQEISGWWDDISSGAQSFMNSLGSMGSAFSSGPIGTSGSGPAAGAAGAGEAAKDAGKEAEKAAEKFDGLAVATYNALVKAIKSGSSQAKTAMDNLVQTIQAADKAIGHGRASALVKHVRQQQGALVALWESYEAANDKLKKEQDKLKDLVNDRASLVSSVSNNLQSGLNLAGSKTFKSVFSKVSGFAAKLKTFAGLLTDMAKAGVPASLIQEVASLGVVDGTAVAKAILQGSATQIGELAEEWGAIEAWSKTAGEIVGGAMFDTAIAAQEGFVKGLEADTAELKKAAEDFALKFAKWVKEALGIHSPSKVFEDIAGNTMAGFANGLDPAVAIRAMKEAVQIIEKEGVTDNAFGSLESDWTDAWIRMLATFRVAWGEIAETMASLGVPGGTDFAPPPISSTDAAIAAFSPSVGSSGEVTTTTSTASKVVTIEAGAFQIVGPDPRRTAIEVVDRIVEVSA